MKNFICLLFASALLPFAAMAFEIKLVDPGSAPPKAHASFKAGGVLITASSEEDALGMYNKTVQELTIKKQTGQALNPTEEVQWNELLADRKIIKQNGLLTQPVCVEPVKKGYAILPADIPNCTTLPNKTLEEAPYVEEREGKSFGNIQLAIDNVENPKIHYRAPFEKRHQLNERTAQIKKKWEPLRKANGSSSMTNEDLDAIKVLLSKGADK